MMDPYAHPPYKKTIKHLLYVSNGSGIQSEVVSSLNHEVVVPFLCSSDLGFWLNFHHSGQTIVVVTEWWWIQKHIHHTRRQSNTFIISKMEVGSSLKWFAASTMKQWCFSYSMMTGKCLLWHWSDNGSICLSITQEEIQTTFLHLRWKWDPVWSSEQPQPPCHCGASHTQWWPWILADCPTFWANMCGGDGVMMDPYAYPLHKKTIKHLYYI